jgi:hypothetical protein
MIVVFLATRKFDTQFMDLSLSTNFYIPVMDVSLKTRHFYAKVMDIQLVTRIFILYLWIYVLYLINFVLVF